MGAVPSVLGWLIVMVAGMGAIVWGAELFAEHLAAASSRLGVSAFALALLLAGAEPEELATVATASARGVDGVAFGDVIGANAAVATLALAVTAHAAVKLMRGLRSGAEPNPEQRRDAITFAICMYPWIVIALALAGKRNVQPFHFSFVQIPLALGAAYCLDTAWRQGSLARRLACGLVVSLALLELGHTASREPYFWKREDSRRIAKIFDTDVMRFGMRSEKWPHDSEHVVKKLFVISLSIL